MAIPSLYQKSLARIYEMYSKDAGKALIHLGTAGTALSTVAQSTMIAKNKDIAGKDKGFLITQEITDGAINVGLLYTLSQAVKGIADSLVETGGISLSKTNELIDKFNKYNYNRNDWLANYTNNYVKSVINSNTIDSARKQEILNKSNQNTTLFYEKIISDLENAKKFAAKPKNLASIANRGNTNKELLETVKKAQKEFIGFKNGVGVIAAIAASVLASNIIAPCCRNAVANKVQDIKKNYEPIAIKLPANVLNNATTNKAVIA